MNVNGEDLWRRAVYLRPGQQPRAGQAYILQEDVRRGVRVIGVPQTDGKTAVYTVQQLPESYFDQIKAQRDRNAALSSTRRIAAGVQPLINIPHNLAQVLMSKDGDGREQIDARDYEERDKRLLKLANDSDYRKLRTSEGAV